MDVRTCDGCGTVMHESQPEELLCKHCSKVRRKISYSSVVCGQKKLNPNLLLQLWKSNQYCGICKRSWHSSDGEDWVRIFLNMLGGTGLSGKLLHLGS